MTYITGDTHRDFSRLDKMEFNKDDMLIILGDAGINYSLTIEEFILKIYLNELGIKIFLHN